MGSSFLGASMLAIAFTVPRPRAFSRASFWKLEFLKRYFRLKNITSFCSRFFWASSAFIFKIDFLTLDLSTWAGSGSLVISGSFLGGLEFLFISQNFNCVFIFSVVVSLNFKFKLTPQSWSRRHGLWSFLISEAGRSTSSQNRYEGCSNWSGLRTPEVVRFLFQFFFLINLIQILVDRLHVCWHEEDFFLTLKIEKIS